ncbi:YbjN domain-containing protein [Sanguibacter sp. HDW7]|uniref:YbjN domain-containing protein n=1 Tax=Sanguibacter sp. HDW7 TaxID=2714931 RepID=UPI00140E3BF9|nr:YbjN domain-containing protein [Sanguibacter sp. HDW7]QIK83283.1 YbjN domain-containing protein [Sanguibacter sp. HDW7]
MHTPNTGPVPLPLTREMVQGILDAHEFHYVTDDDGDFGGNWDEHRVWFMLMGDKEEIFQVRGTWSRSVEPEHKATLLRALNEWNRERVFPKMYARVNTETDLLDVHAESSTDLEHGVTAEQLDVILMSGLETAMMAFEHLDTQAPSFGLPELPPAGEEQSEG